MERFLMSAALRVSGSAKGANMQALYSHLFRLLVQKQQAGMEPRWSLQLLKQLLMQGKGLLVHPQAMA